jgi:hypothetical protein
MMPRRHEIPNRSDFRLNIILNQTARLTLLMLFPAAAWGQMVSPTMSDATIVARGGVRIGGTVEWTRFDAIFGPGGTSTIPLGASLSGFLDASALPMLGSVQPAAQTLARAPSLQLSLGTLQTSADSRIATVPLSIEYGLTSRITLGVNVPIVQSRTVLTTALNPRGDSTANLGMNPAGFFNQSSAFSANNQVTSALDAARQQLAQAIATCTASPTSTGCPALLARSKEANDLVADAASFSDAAVAVYGVSAAQPGAPFAPLSGSALQQAINNHLSDIRAGFASFGFNGGTAALAAANGPAANAQLQTLVNDARFGIGLDSIGSTDQLAIGDVELSATTQLLNTFTDSATDGLHLRGALAGVVRLGTGHRARENRPLDVATGDGQMDLEVRGALDVMLAKRFLTTIAATYTDQLGSLAYDRLPYSPGSFFVLDEPVNGTIKLGSMASIRVNPRFLITRGLMVGGLFTAAYRAGDQVTITGAPSSTASFGDANSRTIWADGFTMSYSNLATHAGIGHPRFPAELLFSHLETVGSNGAGAIKSSRDAIELRLYFRGRR